MPRGVSEHPWGVLKHLNHVTRGRASRGRPDHAGCLPRCVRTDGRVEVCAKSIPALAEPRTFVQWVLKEQHSHQTFGQWRRQQSEGQSGLPSTALDHVSATASDHPCYGRGRGCLLAPSTDRTPPAGTLPPVVSNVRFANSLLGFLIESTRVGPLNRRGMFQKQPRASWWRHKCKYKPTNHHAAASLSFEFVPAPLGVAHDTNATRRTARTTASPCPSHTMRTRGTGRAGTYEAGFVVRVVVVASSSARPMGCSGITRNTATTRKRSAPPHNATNSDLKRSACGIFRTCLVAFFHCDATAGRPGGREHFSCLGCFSTTFG